MSSQHCPYCSSTKVIRRGTNPKQRFQCIDPKHPAGIHRYFYLESTPAKVLVFDIETLPGIKRFWWLGEQDFNPDSIISPWIVLAYSAKWLFDPQVFSGVLTTKEATKRDDKRLVKEIYALMNDADIIIAHNGDKFDLPNMNTRFLYYDMLPPHPYQTIDTLATARKAFNFPSNKLDALAKYLGLESKKHTDYGLWVGCEAGDEKALTYMRSYNEQDVFVLEDVYVKLRPWIKHPNMSLFVVTNANTCPHCGSDDLDWKFYHRTPARVYRAFRCGNCGAIGRNFKSFVSTTNVRVTK